MDFQDIFIDFEDSSIDFEDSSIDFGDSSIVCRGRGQQMDRHGPDCERQLRVLQQRGADQRRLTLAGATRIDHLRAAPEARSTSITARRTAKLLWPARPIQRTTTPRLAPIQPKKLGHRQPRLELDQIHAHRRAPQLRSVGIPRQRLRSRDFELRFGANQVESCDAAKKNANPRERQAQTEFPTYLTKCPPPRGARFNSRGSCSFESTIRNSRQ